MAGKKRTVASDKTQPKLPQGNALANAGGIKSLISSSVGPHQPHQSPYSLYAIHHASQSTGPALAVGAPVPPTGQPSTASSPPSHSHQLPGQLFQEHAQVHAQAQAHAQSRVPHPRQDPLAISGPGPGPGNPEGLVQVSRTTSLGFPF